MLFAVYDSAGEDIGLYAADEEISAGDQVVSGDHRLYVVAHVDAPRGRPVDRLLLVRRLRDEPTTWRSRILDGNAASE